MDGNIFRKPVANQKLCIVFEVFCFSGYAGKHGVKDAVIFINFVSQCYIPTGKLHFLSLVSQNMLENVTLCFYVAKLGIII